jgi:transcriptional antiterminator
MLRRLLIDLNKRSVSKRGGQLLASEQSLVLAAVALISQVNDVIVMSSVPNTSKILTRLILRSPEKKLSEAARIVAEHRNLIRRAIRRGHSLNTLAAELRVPKRTLQRHLNLAGLFLRKPRTGRGVVIRPYKKRKKTA